VSPLKRTILVLTAAAVLAAVVYAYWGAPQKKADFSFALIGEQRFIDPALCTSVQESRIVRALFEGLVILDPKTLLPRPGIAKSWDILDQGREYRFHLRKSVWSDGSPLTAHDFVYSWKRVLEPTSTSTYDYMLFPLRNAEGYRKGRVVSFDSVGVKAIDDSTLVVVLEKPVPYFLDLVAFETLMPVQKACVERLGMRWTRPGNMVCNGAYVLTFHQLNYKLRLEKNARYWNPLRAHFNTVDAYTCEGLNTAFNMYETGDVSLIDDFPTIIAEEILKRKDNQIAPTLGTYFYRFNVTRKPFDDNRVRRAIEMAINKDEICRFVTKGGEVPASTYVPPGIAGYPKVAGAPYNPDSARKLLKAAGFADGRSLGRIELIYNTSENHKKIAEAVSYMLKKELNLDVLPMNIEWKVLLSRVDELDYGFARGSWYGDYTDPNTFLDMFVTGGGNNRTGWSNTRYDSLVNKAAFILVPTERMQVLAQAEQLLLNNGPILPIYYYVSKFLVKPDIHGLYPNIRGYLHVADLYRK